MNRTTGTSILVFGIVLGVIGAVMYWAVTANTDSCDHAGNARFAAAL